MTNPISESFGIFHIEQGKPRDSLCNLHRLLENAYKDLPWPEEIKNIAVFTKTAGGRGDIAAAAKVIKLMQGLNPQLQFKWIVTTGRYSQEELLDFLKAYEIDDKYVIVENELMEHIPYESDFLVVGPISSQDSTDRIERVYKVSTKHPRFPFLECAETISGFIQDLFNHFEGKSKSKDEHYSNFYNTTLGTGFGEMSATGIPLGLTPGAGVFLDAKRVNAQLSLKYSDPKYLFELNDKILQKQILDIMGDSPDYNRFSVNFGYAHRERSWIRFIESVAAHEQDKTPIVILNQKGEFSEISTKDFFEKIVDSPDVIQLLSKLGYGSIIVKDDKEEFKVDIGPSSTRPFIVILREKFLPQDMRSLQLASERLLATGDNTACESWASRCKLYLYENVGNTIKARFLKQQVDLATTIYEPLGRFLELAGKTENFTEKEMHEYLSLLKDPLLSEKTFDFCSHIIHNFAAEPSLQASLKRLLWIQQAPELLEEERRILGDTVRDGLLQIFHDPQIPLKDIPVNLTLLRSRVQTIVESHFQT